MLCKPLELHRLPRDPAFHIPGVDIAALPCIHLKHQLCKCLGEIAPGSVSVFGVDVLLVCFVQEELQQGFGVCQALEYAVHEACVAKVAKTG